MTGARLQFLLMPLSEMLMTVMWMRRLALRRQAKRAERWRLPSHDRSEGGAHQTGRCQLTWERPTSRRRRAAGNKEQRHISAKEAGKPRT